MGVDDLTVDHKVAKSEGGTDEVKNMQTLCRNCNQSKSNLSHNRIRSLFKWFVYVQESRIARGRNPYRIK